MFPCSLSFHKETIIRYSLMPMEYVVLVVFHMTSALLSSKLKLKFCDLFYVEIILSFKYMIIRDINKIKWLRLLYNQVHLTTNLKPWLNILWRIEHIIIEIYHNFEWIFWFTKLCIFKEKFIIIIHKTQNR